MRALNYFVNIFCTNDSRLLYVQFKGGRGSEFG